MTNIAVGCLDGMSEADVVDGAVVAALLVAALGDWWFDSHAALSTATAIIAASSALRMPGTLADRRENQWI